MEDDSIPLDESSLVSGDVGTDPAALAQYAAGYLNGAADNSVSDASGSVSSVSTSSLSPSGVATVVNGISALTGDANSVLRTLNTPAGGVYAAPALPGSLSGIASSLTSTVSSFLPLLFIGFVGFLLFNIAKKHGK
jgi:hypothetical protein